MSVTDDFARELRLAAKIGRASGNVSAVPEEVRKRREEACRECSATEIVDGRPRCSYCGCDVEARLYKADAVCAKNLWPALTEEMLGLQNSEKEMPMG